MEKGRAMDDQLHLDELLGAVAVEIAAQRRITIEEAATFVRQRLPLPRTMYRETGAAFGDDDAGLLTWLRMQVSESSLQ